MAVDLIAQFRKLLPEDLQSPPSLNIQVSIEAELCTKQAEDILVKLKKISTLLTTNKQNYFSNAAYSYSAFTDQQRNQFDLSLKKLFNQVSVKIGELKEVVDKIKFNSTTEKEHLKNMTVCLYQQFKTASNIYHEFREFNETRKKKLQSMMSNKIKTEFKQLYKKKEMETMAITTNSTTNISQHPQRSEDVEPQLKQQCQMVYIEHMLEQKKIEETKQKIEEINQILDVMSIKVLEQELLTSSFREIGEVGLFHIEKGNRNLIDATTLSKDSGRLWTLFFLILAFSLLAFDYLKS